MNSPKPKRVVSRAEYRRYLAKRYGMLLGAVIVTLGTQQIGHAVGYSVGAFLRLIAKGLPLSEWIKIFGAGFLLQSAGLFVLLCSMVTIFAQIRKMEPVEPVSPHNIDRLAPAEALVRGCDAPQTPNTVLLRAAQETETPQEQLLRATK